MTKEEATRIISESPFKEDRSSLIGNLLPSIRIQASRSTGGKEVTESVFGGTPRLPQGMPWPHWDAPSYFKSSADRWEDHVRSKPSHSGPGLRSVIDEEREKAEKGMRPLAYLGQICLSELGAVRAEIGLPQTGTLLFFYDAEECPGAFDPLSRGCGQVIFSTGPVAEAIPPASPLEDMRFTRCSLEFREQWVLPDDLVLPSRNRFSWVTGSRQRQVGIWRDKNYKALSQELMGTPDEPLNRIGGHPQLVQGDMKWECQLASNGVFCGRPEDYKTPNALSLRQGSDDWILLLQLDSDEAPGWMWGDAGRLYFWIRKQELEVADFSKVWTVMQCY